MAFGLSLGAIIVTKKTKNLSLNITKASRISVTWLAINSSLVNYPRKNRILIKGLEKKEKASKFIIDDMWQVIKKGLHISKPEDMQGNGTQKANIRLANGKGLNRKVVTGVQFAKPKAILQKTILYPYRRGAQIISRTFNLCAVVVTVKSGNTKQDYFNIYENAELVK